MKKLCIYHGNCADGFGAAWVVRLAHLAELGPEGVEFFPGVYQDPPPDVTGRDVILVDFSYKRPALIDMAQKAKSILILDHHKSAQADLVDLPDNVQAIFDMDFSGAMLAWDYYFPNQTAPRLIQHIQDRDLWLFKLPGTSAVQAAVYSYPYDFDVWDNLIGSFDLANGSRLMDEGAAIERKHFKDIKELIASAAQRGKIAGHDVPILNAPYFFSSDACHIMGENELFAACYWDTPGGRVFSLRSADGGLDVSQIAALFGGGGHKHAAGFRLPIDQLDRLASPSYPHL